VAVVIILSVAIVVSLSRNQNIFSLPGITDDLEETMPTVSCESYFDVEMSSPDEFESDCRFSDL
jgi:hypothetical protein